MKKLTMNDLKPFNHGEEGTHSVCSKHNIGGKSVCCECSGEVGCGDDPMKSKQNASEHFTGCARNPSYDTSLSVGERLSDYMGKFHIVLHGVRAHEPYYLDCGNKPDERCDDREKKALIEFVSLLVAEERERVRDQYKNLKPIDTAPKDGTTIEALYPDGTLTDIFWSERPVCMLGTVNGGFPEGWATGGRDTDYNLPMDTPIMWIDILSSLEDKK